jgi:hypothetical protein
LTPAPQMLYQTLPYIVVNRPERFTWIPISEVISPAPIVPHDLFDHFRYRFITSIRTSHLPYGVSFPLQRFLRWLDIQIPMSPSAQVAIVPESEPKKVQTLPGFAHVHASGLFPIYAQTESPFNQRFRKAGYLTSNIPRHDNKVIRIADNPCVRPLRRTIAPVEHLVEPVQIQVRQQRTDYSLDTNDNFPLFQNCRYVSAYFLTV